MTGAKLPARVRAIRLKPGEQKHPLVILEMKVDSDPPVAKFRYPVGPDAKAMHAASHGLVWLACGLGSGSFYTDLGV